MASWKRDFGSGLIVLTPLLITVAFLAWIYSYLALVPIPDQIGPRPVRVALTLVVFVLLVFSIGYLMRTAFGAVLERSLDDVMNHLPGLRVIYNASKMAVETALSGAGEFKTPVRLEVWDGLRMTAFKTGNRAPDGREILFLPTAPNITTGFVIEVDEDRYTEVDDNVEDALTRLLSAGFGNNGDTSAAELFSSRNNRPDEVSVADAAEAAARRADEPDTATDGGTGDDVSDGGTGDDVSDGDTGLGASEPGD